MSSQQTDHDDDGMRTSRRSVLKSVGAATAAASIGGHSYFSHVESVGGSQEAFTNEEVTTACWIGKQDCGMRASVVNDRVVHLKPEPNDPTIQGLCPKGVAQIADLYDPYRVKQPLRRTNEKGVPGEFEPIDWETALQEVGEDFRQKAEDDTRKLDYQVGRPKDTVWHRSGWQGAIEERYGPGIDNRGHDAVCANANKYAVSRVTNGFAACMPDWENVDHVLSLGWNATQAGGPHLCNVSFANDMAKAYEEGTTIDVIDPTRRNSGQWCDEWLPIEPGTDIAFFLAFNHVLLEEGYVDEQFLEKNTNMPCLVYTEGPDEGRIARADDAEYPPESVFWCEGELVYDEEAGVVRPHEETLPDDPLDPTTAASASLHSPDGLDVDGYAVSTAFELFEEQVADRDPSWAAEITDIPAAQIERAATRFGENAHIGATTTVEYEGETIRVPYRPVAIATYHGMQCERGIETTHAMLIAQMLVGALDVPGNGRSGYYPEPYASPRRKSKLQAFEPDEYLTWEPDNPSLTTLDEYGGTYYQPDGYDSYGKLGYILDNHDTYNLPYSPEEMGVIVQLADPVSSGPNYERTRDGYAQYDTVVCVDPNISDTASYCADYILPTSTVDKTGNKTGAFSTTHEADLTRSNPLGDWKLFDCRDEGDIYKEIARHMGVEDEYVERINEAFGTDYDAIPEGDGWVQEVHDEIYDDPGHTAGGDEMDLADRYPSLYAWRVGDREAADGRPDLTRTGFKYQPYLESWELIGREMERAWAEDPEAPDEIDRPPYIDSLNGFPTWNAPTMWDSPDEYPYTLFDHKKIEHKQSRTNQNALINELDPQSYVRMHPDTADEIGVEEGDRVEVTSHNAFLDEEVGTIEGEVRTMQSYKPDTICIPFHHTSEEGPNVKALDEGCNVNRLFDTTEGYQTWAGDTSFHIRVRVEPAGGDGT